MASLPGRPGSLGLPSGTPQGVDGHDGSSGTPGQPTGPTPPADIDIVNVTYVTGGGPFPPTTLGNTICYVSVLRVGNAPSLGDGTTTPFLRLLNRASFGPISSSDSSPSPGGDGLQKVGLDIYYLENIPEGATNITGIPVDETGLVYELTPCVFDVCGSADNVAVGGSSEVWSGTITPTSGNDFAVALQDYDLIPGSPAGNVTDPGWQNDASDNEPQGLDTHVAKVFSNFISGSSLFSSTKSGHAAINWQSLGCFKPIVGPFVIGIVDRRRTLDTSGAQTIRTTSKGDAIIVIADIAASVSADIDAMVQVATGGNWSIWFCNSIGGSTTINFTSDSGIIVYELGAAEGFEYTLFGIQTGTTDNSSVDIYGRFDLTLQVFPDLVGDVGPCAYFWVQDFDLDSTPGGIPLTVGLSDQWRQDPENIGHGGEDLGPSPQAAVYYLLNHSGTQQLSGVQNEGSADSLPYDCVGIVLGFNVSESNDDLNQMLPNTWVLS